MEAFINKIENFERPSAKLICTLVLASYFLVTAGIAYDIIHEPPAIGGVQDPLTGKVKPQAFLPYRLNGQYIMEGMSGAFLYTLGGLGIIALDYAHTKSLTGTERFTFKAAGIGFLLTAYAGCMLFLRIKMPNYLG